ncbi:hypothetical protein I8D64_11615 [Brachybacterium sp. MASK1Z-5]|uniref:Uncharacterized protein n=1 Tax=Brachybacterium halotolerans TaxID=2795215 RepID=A0ABS1BBL0_9MICO|nr:hypothetical protein [Brachybacterium halotolerans]MBK0332046.1 hypothetical protein [Brachybacterium halotolerans]
MVGLIATTVSPSTAFERASAPATNADVLQLTAPPKQLHRQPLERDDAHSHRAPIAIQRLVDSAPPLTAPQRERLAVVLSGGQR